MIARGARAEEKAVNLRVAGLAEAAVGRGRPAEALSSDDRRKTLPPMHGALLKNEQDVHLFERLIFSTSEYR